MRRWAILAAIGTLAVLAARTRAQFVTPPLVPAQTPAESSRASQQSVRTAPPETFAEDVPKSWMGRFLKKIFPRRRGGKVEARAEMTWVCPDSKPPLETFAELRVTSVQVVDKACPDHSIETLRRWAESVGVRTPSDAPTETPETPLADEGTVAPPPPGPLTYIGTIPAAEPVAPLPLPPANR